jgi:hypothetical protein
MRANAYESMEESSNDIRHKPTVLVETRTVNERLTNAERRKSIVRARVCQSLPAIYLAVV